ncbi:MAG: AAA family ATPase [Clostridium fessum]
MFFLPLSFYKKYETIKETEVLKVKAGGFYGKKLKLPVGIDGFEKIRRNGFYYIDKTKLIEQLFLNWGEVNLFTRPRRFGKTLNMSMLKSFFEIGTDTSLFDGLYVSENKELCEQHQGQYPVIFLL